jgi:hypothetical protein
MAKNKLSDLNNHLFAQLERLGEEDLTIEEIHKEVERGKTISMLASTVIKSAKITIDSMRLVANGEYTVNELPEMIGMHPRQKPKPLD